jgi:hypothetical protein
MWINGTGAISHKRRGYRWGLQLSHVAILAYKLHDMTRSERAWGASAMARGHMATHMTKRGAAPNLGAAPKTIIKVGFLKNLVFF